jgi:predicted kinase
VADSAAGGRQQWTDAGFVLVGGWPASGKSTLSAALADALGLPLIAKDEIKEALMEGLGRPGTVEESRRLGRAAVLAMMRVARRCPGAVLDSTWFAHTLPHVRALPGPLVEVRCEVPLAVARERYRARVRAPGHLDDRRTETELWGRPVPPLGVGPLVTLDTTGPVDVAALAARILAEFRRAG